MFGTSDAWTTCHLSQRTSIFYCRLSDLIFTCLWISLELALNERNQAWNHPFQFQYEMVVYQDQYRQLLENHLFLFFLQPGFQVILQDIQNIQEVWGVEVWLLVPGFGGVSEGQQLSRGGFGGRYELVTQHLHSRSNLK